MTGATRVGAPLEDIALDEIRAGNEALGLTLAFRTNIDNEAASACGLEGFARRQPPQPFPSPGQELVDPRRLGTSTDAPLRQPNSSRSARIIDK